MDQQEVMVSICCTVYNHEKYLRQCLDGFMMQKTNFKFEVLIHDDASTDGSADIIREYQSKYPDIIKPIIQTENQHSKGVKITWTYQYPRAKGKYIALCEGDDYWTDEYKLQKQFDALENNPDCVFCTHTVRCVTGDNKKLERTYPPVRIDEKIITSDAWIKNICDHVLFQTSSYFARNILSGEQYDQIPTFIKKAKIGDIPISLYFASKGNCIYINEEMSCYRMNTSGSWSQRVYNVVDNRISSMKNEICFSKLFDEYTNKKYHTYVNNRILKLKFDINVLSERFDLCLRKEYRPLFSKLSFKTKVLYTFFGLFPFLRPVYQKLRHKQ